MGLWWWDSLFIVSISELFVINFSEIFGMVSGWLVRINLASFILPYSVIFNNLLIYQKYYWVILH